MGVLDVVPGPAKVDADLAGWVEGKLAERVAARQARDFGRADAIRKEVEGKGVEIEDTPQGPKWRLR
jgi:cysteinyl-tRNA synthetase